MNSTYPVMAVVLLAFSGQVLCLAAEPTHTEFIYLEAPFPQCHASTIAETPAGLVAAWFGGTREKHPDVGIWVARKLGTAWSDPVEVANGIQADASRHPCWNPVLHQFAGGDLSLFYKVGPDPASWWGMQITSSDQGETWSAPQRLPAGISGPIKNKPIQLKNGSLLCGSSTENSGWRVHMEITPDQGETWSRTADVADSRDLQAIQPTILVHPEQRLQILCRARTPGKVVSSWSNDLGASWSDLTPTSLPNPNSGIDAMTLSDGRQLLVYNHTQRGRSPLNVAVSSNGTDWSAAAVLEHTPGEYSYPAVIQSHDGLVHITYTWKRERVKHVTLDPEQFVLRPIVDGEWPE